MRAYGIDVTDPQVSLRRINLAMHHLPMGAWPEADHAAAWSTECYLLANVIDLLQQLVYVFTAANSKQKPPQPKPYPRPGGDVRPQGEKTKWGDLPGVLMNLGRDG